MMAGLRILCYSYRLKKAIAKIDVRYSKSKLVMKDAWNTTGIARYV
jgi:hypothetical protein